ncbi:hypothetical protein LB557_23640, partial [Mesorhizobium sp. BR115XR7A]|uniref:hypothetical protein n=1 Tax=Mesorhizobium sp. BR115XR7A TaxID=2876645 RepID=UPI001CD0C56F
DPNLSQWQIKTLRGLIMRRGKRPLPQGLRLVEGTYRSDRHGPAESAHVAAQERLIKPDWMRGGVGAAWDRFIAPAGWLDVFREPSAIAFCELWEEFQAWPVRFPASKHGQMRGYMNDLALSGRCGRI